MRSWELTIYKDGTAILTDDAGETVWTSQDDDDFAAEFPEVLTFDEADEVGEYLEDNEILPDDVGLEIVEAEASLEEAYDLDDDDDEEEE